MKKLIRILLFVIFICSILFCLSRVEVVLKGGTPVEVSSSMEEAKKNHTFIEEYSRPVFEYKDSLMDIKLVFQDAYVEHGRWWRRHVINFGEPDYIILEESRYFMAHFSSEAKLDDYYYNGKPIHDSPIYYKWYALDQYYIHNYDLTKGYGAIGRRAWEKDSLGDTITFVLKHDYNYYRYSNLPLPDSRYQKDTIGVIKFTRLAKQ